MPLAQQHFSFLVSRFCAGCSESITLGLPGRDDDIQQVCRCIEAAGKAGLRGLNYNFLVSNQRATYYHRAASNFVPGVVSVELRSELPTCVTIFGHTLRRTACDSSHSVNKPYCLCRVHAYA
jgi:hypothetical protein